MPDQWNETAEHARNWSAPGTDDHTITARPVSASRRAVLATSVGALTGGCLRLSDSPAEGGSDGNVGSDGADAGEGGATIEVLSLTGLVAGSGETLVVHLVELTTKRAPESSAVDLGETTIELVTDSGSTNFVHASAGQSPGFYLDPIRTESDSGAVLASEADRITVKLPLGPTPPYDDLVAVDPLSGTSTVENDLSPFREGDRSTITLSPASGSGTTARATMPDTLTDTEAVRL